MLLTATVQLPDTYTTKQKKQRNVEQEVHILYHMSQW